MNQYQLVFNGTVSDGHNLNEVKHNLASLLYKSPSSATEVENAPHTESTTSKDSQKKGIKGLGDIISGVVLIGIGFVVGGSVFMGDTTWLDYFFDGLGLFWIGRGIYKMVR